MTRERTITRIIDRVMLVALVAFITSCNDIQKSKSVKKAADYPLTAPIKFYLLKYKEDLMASTQKEGFLKSLKIVNESIAKINSQMLSSNDYNTWQHKINRVDSTKLLIQNLNQLNYNLQYYFALNYQSNLNNASSIKVRNKVLKDAFFIKDGFGFYSSLWYLQPSLSIDQNSYYRLIEGSKLFNLVLTGWADDMTDLTADWIVKEDKDGFPLNLFRIINPSLAKKLKNEFDSNFLVNNDKENASFKLIDDFLTKEVNKQAIVLIEYVE
jgi:hypothetical protein